MRLLRALREDGKGQVASDDGDQPVVPVDAVPTPWANQRVVMIRATLVQWTPSVTSLTTELRYRGRRLSVVILSLRIWEKGGRYPPIPRLLLRSLQSTQSPPLHFLQMYKLVRALTLDVLLWKCSYPSFTDD
jgi:hypothetical protein